MQDVTDGSLHKIPGEIAKRLQEHAETCGTPLPVFRVGEVLELRGGRFRVTAIGKRYMRLEGLPGTRINDAGTEDSDD